MIAPIVGVIFAYDAVLDDPRFAMGVALVAAALFLAIGGALILAWAQWRRFTFHVEEGALRVEQGLLIRRSTRLTSERIQSVDTKANLVFRVLGLVTLDIHTAGKSQEPEVSIPALLEDEAADLARVLRMRGAAAAGEVPGVTAPGGNGDAVAEDIGQEATPAAAGPTWRLSGRETFIVATTSNAGILALAATGPLAVFLVPVLPEEFIGEWLSESATWTVLALFGFFALLTLLFAWVVGSVTTLLQYWEFATVRTNGEVRVEQGLLQRNTRNVPLDRVQAVRLVEGPLRQMIGRITVGVDSAGIAVSSEFGPTVLHPLLTRPEARRFCDLMVPGHTPPRLLPLPERSRRRYIVRATAVPLLIAVPLAAFVPFGWIALVAPAVAAGWARLAYQDAAWGITGDVLGIRWRGFGRSTALVRRRRIQSAAVSQHPLQKRVGLATLSVRVAASPATAVFTVRHLDEEDALRVLEWVSHSVERTGESV